MPEIKRELFVDRLLSKRWNGRRIFSPPICWIISLQMEKILLQYTPIPGGLPENAELPWYLE